MSNKPPTPPCIQCGRVKSVQRVGAFWKCTKCGALFDDDPSEGGDFTANPAGRMMREERKRDEKRRKLGEQR